MKLIFIWRREDFFFLRVLAFPPTDSTLIFARTNQSRVRRKATREGFTLHIIRYPPRLHPRRARCHKQITLNDDNVRRRTNTRVQLIRC